MYIFSKIVELIVGVILAATISGCTSNQTIPDVGNELPNIVVAESEMPIQDNNESGMNSEVKEQILKLVNNKESADILIKTTYSEEMLYNLKDNINELMLETPPECVRLSEKQDAVYFVYKSDTGHYMFLLYSFAEDTGRVTRGCYYGKPILLADFERMKNEDATLEDVQEFDPYGGYGSLYMGSTTSLYTYHDTIDGYMIRIDYGSPFDSGEEYSDTISKITKYSGEDNPVYYNMLPIDRELLRK